MPCVYCNKPLPVQDLGEPDNNFYGLGEDHRHVWNCYFKTEKWLENQKKQMEFIDKYGIDAWLNKRGLTSQF